MAIVKISDLPLVDQPVEGTDLFVVVQDNVTKKAYASDIQTYVGFEEFQTATAGQTVFNLTTMTYAAGANNLQVFVDGVNQYEGLSYVETDNNTVTFTQGLHVGAVVKFSTVQTQTSSVADAGAVTFLQAGTGAVARSVQSKLREEVSVTDFGADTTGTIDCTAALQAAVASGAKSIYFPKGSYLVAAAHTINLVNDVTIYGEGVITYSGAALANNIWTIVCGGYNVILSGLVFNGSNLAAGGVYIRNTTPMSSSLPTATVRDCTFRNFRMLSATDRNFGYGIAGSFETVYLTNNRVENITRAAGTATPGVTGTSGAGASIINLGGGELRWIRQCVHTGNSYNNISSSDASGSANNYDMDGFIYAVPNPNDFPNSDGTQKTYIPSLFISSGNTFTNCRGRALKSFGVANISNEKIIRNSGYCLTGGSTEIDLIYGVGNVTNITFMYYDYLSGGVATSPLVGGVTLVSAYTGSYYNEQSTGTIINGLTVYNEIKSSIANNSINTILSAAVGYATAIDRPLVSLSNVIVNRNPVVAIAVSDFPSSDYGLLSIDNVSVAKISQAAVLVSNTNGNRILNATNIINIDGVKTPANIVPFFRESGTFADAGWSGIVNGFNIQGFELNYVGSAISTRQTPMLVGGALTGVENHGGLSVQSVSLADDASYAFARRGVEPTRLLVGISVSYGAGTQGLLSCGDNDIYVIAATTPNDFEASTTGSNPDVDGKVNLWFTGNKLNVKNRLGSSRIFTISFLG